VVETDARIRVIHRGHVIADTRRARRVLETSQPPAFYLPPADVDRSVIVASPRRSTCEWKGVASYWSIAIGDGEVLADAAWSYEHPVAGFEPIAHHLAFYAQAVDECWVDDERVVPNPGMFYGGWITSKVVGPFKGAAGTLHW
jgi:uncharacterized protein (DUF427 family)